MTQFVCATKWVEHSLMQIGEDNSVSIRQHQKGGLQKSFLHLNPNTKLLSSCSFTKNTFKHF